jgi:hypothetical protein
MGNTRFEHPISIGWLPKECDLLNSIPEALFALHPDLF